MDEKIIELEQKFLYLQNHLLENSGNKRDLDEAMGDTDGATKEQIKIDMYNFGINLFEQAKQESNLEDLTSNFMNQLDKERSKIEQLMTEAREQGNTKEMIENQIRISVLDSPIRNGFQGYLKQVQET